MRSSRLFGLATSLDQGHRKAIALRSRELCNLRRPPPGRALICQMAALKRVIRAGAGTGAVSILALAICQGGWRNGDRDFFIQ